MCTSSACCPDPTILTINTCVPFNTATGADPALIFSNNGVPTSGYVTLTNNNASAVNAQISTDAAGTNVIFFPSGVLPGNGVTVFLASILDLYILSTSEGAGVSGNVCIDVIKTVLP